MLNLKKLPTLKKALARLQKCFFSFIFGIRSFKKNFLFQTLLKRTSFHAVIISLIFESIVQSASFAVSAFVISTTLPSSSLASDVVVEDPNIKVYEQNYNNNAVDVIETIKSNDQGLSHNKFVDFNALEKAKVINNSASDGNSQLAGQVVGNSNFEGNAGYEAQKILFEVSGNASRLEKDIEIFGSKADFILVNSKGIMCNGCGFINTANTSFITGSVVNANNPNNIQYQINHDKNATILIGNNGITFYGNNNENFDLNLISRAVRIAGEVRVNNAKLNNLNVKTGAGGFNNGAFTTNYQNTDSNNVVDAGKNDGTNANEGFSVVIDSTALGGVRANQISIIATELGAGVRNDQSLISDLGSIDINAQGQIVAKENIASQTNVNLTSATNITNQGNLSANSNVNLNATNDITNSGTVSGITTNLTATNDITNSGTISGTTTTLSATNITNNTNSTISSTSGNLTLTSTNNITNSGTLSSSATTTLTATNDITNSSTGSISALNISATANNITNNNQITATSTINLTATNDITNSKTITSATTTLSATNITNNTNSTISSTSGNLTLTSTNNITNSGTISGATTNLSAANNITNNTASTISSTSGNLTLSLNGILTNSANITSAANLIILGNSTFINNANGSNIKLSAGNSGSIQITAKKLTNNQNLDLKGGFLTLSNQVDQGLINNALITSSNSNLVISGAMQNNALGILQSAQNRNIILNSLSGEMINLGQIKTDSELRLTGNIINRNIIARIDDSIPLDINNKKYLKILINEGTLTNDTSGRILTNNYLLIDGNNNLGNLTNLGLLRSSRLSDVNNFNDDDAINIKNLNVLNNSGVIDSSEDLVISASEINNNEVSGNHGLLFGGIDVILNTDKLTNQNANIISSSGDVKIQKEIIANLDGSETYVKSSEVNNINGQIKTLKSKVDAPLFNEADVKRVLEQYSKEMLATSRFSATELTNRIYALRGFLKDSSLSIEEQMNQSVSGTVRINAVNLNNNQNSVISANNYIKINADNIINNNNSVLASANYFDIIANDLQNLNSSQIFGATVLKIEAQNDGDLNNQIINSGLIRGSAVYLNTTNLTNSTSSSNSLNSVFGQSFASDDYGFSNNNLFKVSNDNFLISINKDVAESTDNNTILSSFFDGIGFDYQNNSTKILGDDIYLADFVANILQDKTNSRYLTFDATSDYDQLSSMLETTKTQMQNLGINFGEELTQNQRANLTDPFIAFNKQEVFVKDGNVYNTEIAGATRHEVFVPQIITPNTTTANQETSNIATQTNDAIQARNEMLINASKQVNNKSDIKAATIVIETGDFNNEASTTLALDANGNLITVAKTPTIKAQDDVVIIANNNFNNKNANISAGKSLLIEANNDFNVISTTNQNSNFDANNIQVTANNANINGLNLNSNNLLLGITNNLDLTNSAITSNNIYVSDLEGSANINNSNIKTTSTLEITANNNIAITKSNIDSDGLQLVSHNDLNINDSNLNNSYLVTQSNNNSNINKTNINSDIIVVNANGNLNLNDNNIASTNIASFTAQKNANLIGNDIDATNQLEISAQGDLNITTRQEISRSSYNTRRGKWTRVNESSTIKNSGFNSLSGGNIILSSGNNTNIIGANISTTLDGIIEVNAGNNLTITSANDTSNNEVWDRYGRYNRIVSKSNKTNKQNATTLNSQNIYLNSNNNLSITSTNINANDLIATSQGKITFKQNKYKTTGTLALMNDKNTVSSLLSTNTSTTNQVAATQNNTASTTTTNTTTKSNTATAASSSDIVFEAGTTQNSLNNLILSTDADIINYGSLIAGGDINLNAKNITNSKVANTTYHSRGFNTTISGEGLIQAEGSVFLKATNNINNNAGTIIAKTGDITLLAGGNVNIGTMQQRSYTDVGGKFRYRYDKITNHASNITAGNNIIIKAGDNSTIKGSATAGNINITGSNLTAGNDATTSSTDGGNIIMNASNNINVVSSTDTFLNYGNDRKSSFYRYTQTNKQSNLTAGKNSTSGGVYLNQFNIDATTGAVSTKSTTDLSLNDTSNNVNVKAANIKAKSEAYIKADNDINIEANQDTSRIVNAFHSRRRGWRNETSTTTNIKSSIESQGNLVIEAGNDANLIGADLSTEANAQITAVRNINIEAVKDKNYYFQESYKKGSFGRRSRNSQTIDETTNISTNITANGDVVLNSQNDISIKASNITSNTGDIELIAKGDVNVESESDVLETKETKNRHGITTTAINNKTRRTISQVSSIINSKLGDVSLVSGNNATISSSSLLANNDINIKVGYYLDNATNTETINNDAVLNILNGKDSIYNYEYSYKVGADFNAIAVGMAAGFATGGVVGMAAGAYVGSQAQKGHIAMKETFDETIVSSTLTANNNINIESAGDTLIRSSKLDSGNDVNITVGSITNKDNIIINTNNSANLFITSDQEQHIKNEYYQKIKPDYFAIAAMAAVSGFLVSYSAAGASQMASNYMATGSLGATIAMTTGTAIASYGLSGIAGSMLLEASSGDNLARKDISESRYEENKQVESNILTTNDLNVVSANNINISASNIYSNKDVNLVAEGEVNIVSAQEVSRLTTRREKQSFGDLTAGYDRGRLSAGIAGSIFEENTTTDKSNAKSSDIVANNINITANKDVNVAGSKLTTFADSSLNGGDINLASNKGNVNIISSQDIESISRQTKIGTVSLTLGVGNAHVDLAYAEYDYIKAVKDVADAKKNLNHMETLHKNNQAEKDAVDDAKTNLEIALLNLALAQIKVAASAAKSAGSCAESLCTGFYGDIRLAISGTKTNFNSNSSTAVASNINSYNDIVIKSGLGLSDNDNDLLSGIVGNTKIEGSNISSSNGDINITSRNNTSITASKDTYSSSTKSEGWQSSVTLASSNTGGAGAVIDNIVNALQLSLAGAISKSKGDVSSTTYNNSTINAQNGDIKINSLNNTEIKGANILSQNTTINTQNNLTIESLQNKYYAKSKSFGLNLGVGSGLNSSGSSLSFGINRNSSKTDRLWTDNQTTIIGTNSVNINTGNNTNNKGAMIANITNISDSVIASSENQGVAIQPFLRSGEAIDGNNLTLNTKTLTFSNLFDHEYSSNSGFGFSTSIGATIDGNNSNPIQNLNFYPDGSTTISLNNSGYKKEQTTKATIGSGIINVGGTQNFDNITGEFVNTVGGTLLSENDSQLSNLNRNINSSQEITKDTITNALNVSATIDNRVFAAVYEGAKYLVSSNKSEVSTPAYDSLINDQKNLGKNLKIGTKGQGELLETVRETAENAFSKVGLKPVGTALTAPTQIAEGTIFTFLEEKNSLEGSYLINKNGITTDPTQTKNYAVNGIITTNDTAFTNYISDPNNDVTLRYNPTHGFFGDLMESAIGKIANIIGTPQIVAMNNYVAEDLYERKNLPNSTNTFHSQGSIIGTGAIKLYANTYQLGFDTNGNALPRWQDTQINQTQQFVAVGPAVLRSDWEDTTLLLGEKIKENADYSHNENDPIRYLTAPSNVITDVVGLFTNEPVKSSIYIPNLITNIPLGIKNAILHMEKHDVKDSNYSKFLKGLQEQNSQNPSTAPPNN